MVTADNKGSYKKSRFFTWYKAIVYTWRMDRSKGELGLSILLGLLQWVLPMNPLIGALVWIGIGGLSSDLILRSHWTTRWYNTPKILVCIAIAALVGWKATDTFKAKNGEMQIVIKKFDLLPFMEGKPLRVNIVVNNTSSKTLTVKTYAVTSLEYSPNDVQGESSIEDKLHGFLAAAMKATALSREIPPSPPSWFHTLELPALNALENVKFQNGTMRFYFLGAIVHGDGTTIYCLYTTGDRVIRLCQRQS